MSPPCVVGRELAEAERLLAEAGVTVADVTETAPPKAHRPTGPRRVVQQRETAAGVRLVVAASIVLPHEKHDDDGSQHGAE